jgi:hypothetical protein
MPLILQVLTFSMSVRRVVRQEDFQVDLSDQLGCNCQRYICLSGRCQAIGRLKWSLIVHEASVGDANNAVAAAKAAFPAWSALSPKERGSYLHKLAKLIIENNEELAYLEAISMGRPLGAFFDAYYAADHFAHYAETGWEAQGTSRYCSRNILRKDLLTGYQLEHSWNG